MLNVSVIAFSHLSFNLELAGHLLEGVGPWKCQNRLWTWRAFTVCQIFSLSSLSHFPIMKFSYDHSSQWVLGSLSPAVYRGLDEEEHGSKKRRNQAEKWCSISVYLPAKPEWMSGLIRESGGRPLVWGRVLDSTVHVGHCYSQSTIAITSMSAAHWAKESHLPPHTWSWSRMIPVLEMVKLKHRKIN